MTNPATPTASNAAPQMVHEAEAQRQHIRINLPASVHIDGQNYPLADWSVGGISVVLEGNMSAPATMREKGSVVDSILQFQFDGFALSVPVQLEVGFTSDDRIGCKFVNSDRNQRSIMQYLVTAYTSGELVNTGDLLDVVARNNMTKPRNVPDPLAGLTSAEIAKHKMAKLFKTGTVALISALLLAYILSSVYERLYIVQATSAQVTAQMLTVDAPAGGKLYYAPILPDMKVKKGQPLLNVSTTTGANFTVDSPCDCIVKKRLLANNRLARKGEPALELVRPDTRPYVEAYIAHKEAVKLSIKQEALMALPGHNSYLRGTISIIQAGKGMGGNSLVRIEPNQPLPVEFVDDPVEVRIDTLRIL
ncbi:MAG: HlyD family efflux transporter periplasmic adaptor subunit [Rickettsiales bacterium]|nr:HlyD family efflux transporter periplasmic adaptor subunit [Rickettsiales bacterium]